MDELLARIRAAARRAGSDVPVLETGDLVIDLPARRVTRAGAVVRLTPTEWALLEMLVRTPGRLVGQRELLHEVWGPSYGRETNYLRVYDGSQRKKLEVDPAPPRYVNTEPGMGYRFEVRSTSTGLPWRRRCHGTTSGWDARGGTALARRAQRLRS
jgi:two-component system KDP operon response regulator KdpE